MTHNGQWVRVSPNVSTFEDVVRPAVWSMVQATYAKIGLIVDSPRDLDEYNVWDVYEDSSGELHAFVLGKFTPNGVKLGLAGSDGSKIGRAAVKTYTVAWFHMPNHYAEVSHRLEELARESDAPLVCAVYAPTVLHKQVALEADGVHYRRTIKNVGEVTKIIVGLPSGVPVTSSETPHCPLPPHDMQGRARGRAVDDSMDAVFAHAASIVRL